MITEMRRGIERWKVLPLWVQIVAGFVVLSVLVYGVSSAVGYKPKGDSSSAHAAATSTVTSTPTIPSTSTPAKHVQTPQESAAAFIDKHQRAIHDVIVEIQAMAGGAQFLDGSAGTSAEFDSLCDDAANTFTGARSEFGSASDPKGLGGDAGVSEEMSAASDELIEACKSARSFLDSQKPSDLQNFTQHWQNGTSWWKEALTKLYSQAGQPVPDLGI